MGWKCRFCNFAVLSIGPCPKCNRTMIDSIENKTFSHYECILIENPFIPWANTRLEGYYWSITEVWIGISGQVYKSRSWSERVFRTEAEKILYQKNKK